MSLPQDIIAWLVPSTRYSSADKATQMPQNASRLITTSSSRLSSTITPSKPQNAIELSFSQPPKQPGSFIIGTDTRTCDIVLPQTPGISPQHCALTFDAESRLVLDDFSQSGTQVWYDWESSGDRTDYSWILSSGNTVGFPSNTVQRITIDIQGMRFLIIVNDHSADWDAYVAKVDAFCEQPSWEDDWAAPWIGESMLDMMPLCSAASSAVTSAATATTPLFKHIMVTDVDNDTTGGSVYLWNMARPWEPMVKASA